MMVKPGWLYWLVGLFMISFPPVYCVIHIYQEFNTNGIGRQESTIGLLAESMLASRISVQIWRRVIPYELAIVDYSTTSGTLDMRVLIR